LDQGPRQIAGWRPTARARDIFAGSLTFESWAAGPVNLVTASLQRASAVRLPAKISLRELSVANRRSWRGPLVQSVCQNIKSHSSISY